MQGGVEGGFGVDLTWPLPTKQLGEGLRVRTEIELKYSEIPSNNNFQLIIIAPFIENEKNE